MTKAAICGASGYTGAELLRILANHPKIKVTAVTSERSEGMRPSDIYPHLYPYDHLLLEPMDKAALLRKADVFFMALPHGASQEAVDYFVKKGRKVVDLSADYRLKDPSVYEAWYKTAHKHKATLGQAVYGLPELHRREIKKATLVANPGCYPTSAILALHPLVKNKAVDLASIVVDSKSGTSGAGRKADVGFAFCEVNDSFKAYGVATHRHTPEIEQELSLAAGEKITVEFTPHLLPVDRGILSTMYVKLDRPLEEHEIAAIYDKAYGREPFVRVLKPGSLPSLKHVRGSNTCMIGFKFNARTGRLIIVSVIDNLVKGASGQAVQCMNLMLGLKENTGLGILALNP